jgi:D-alanyl-D-alanine carboxypeptidase
MRAPLLAGITAAALLATPTTAAATPRAGWQDRPTVAAAGLQDRLDAVVAAGAVGALAEVRDDHGVWRGTSGSASLGRHRAVPAASRFRAGSITKTFVATVVLQLVAEGRIRLTDPVEDWLPGVVPDGDHITVRHLLDHTSGLADYLDTLTLPPDPAFLDNRWRTRSSGDLIRRALANPPTSDLPGTRFDYSNTNYLLLGQIVGKATGRPYGREIERRIIRPLGLRGTSLPGTAVRIPGPHPRGYVPIERDGELHLVDYTEMNPSVMGASGEIISTTADLNRFFAALLGGRLLPPRLLAEMKTQRVEGRGYGLGLAWWHETSCHVRVYGNDGDALAYQAWSYSTEDHRRQVTVAFTPTFHGDTDAAVTALVDEAICG